MTLKDPSISLPLRQTTLLGHLALKNGVDEADFKFNADKKTFDKTIPKTLEYIYEAMLGQCAYLCRLIYSPTDIFLRGITEGMELLPKDKNNLITKLEYESFKERPNYQSWFLSSNIPNIKPVNRGKFYPISNTAIFQHYDASSKINKRRTVYVVCKGTSNMKETIKDLKFLKIRFDISPIFAAVPGVPEVSGVPGFVHKGFFDHVIYELADILADIRAYALPDVAAASNTKTVASNTKNGTNIATIQPSQADQIIITGHSLGGASATIIALALAHATKNETFPKIHCVTFGAPKLLSDDSRIYFNEFLISGKMTYDRVVTNGDVVTNIPPGPTVHPGFRLLQTELNDSEFKKTGRSGYIDHIRQLAANITRKKENEKNDVQWDIAKHPILKDVYKTEQHISEPPLTDAAKAAAAKPVDQLEGAKEGGGQVGGLALTRASRTYKSMTKLMYPNTVNYKCNKILSKGVCHCAYMDIGFTAALQLPIGPKGFMRRDALKKRTMFISNSGATLDDTFKPANRMFVVLDPVANATIGGRRQTRRLRSRRQ